VSELIFRVDGRSQPVPVDDALDIRGRLVERTLAADELRSAMSAAIRRAESGERPAIDVTEEMRGELFKVLVAIKDDRGLTPAPPGPAAGPKGRRVRKLDRSANSVVRRPTEFAHPTGGLGGGLQCGDRWDVNTLSAPFGSPSAAWQGDGAAGRARAPSLVRWRHGRLVTLIGRAWHVPRCAASG
jgi:hypothetical protein